MRFQILEGFKVIYNSKSDSWEKLIPESSYKIKLHVTDNDNVPELNEFEIGEIEDQSEDDIKKMLKKLDCICLGNLPLEKKKRILYLKNPSPKFVISDFILIVNDITGEWIYLIPLANFDVQNYIDGDSVVNVGLVCSNDADCEALLPAVDNWKRVCNMTTAQCEYQNPGTQD